MTWSWTVLGAPVGKGRPRFSRLGPFVRAYTPAKTARWEDVAALIFADGWSAPPLEGPVSLSIVAVMPRPKRLMRAKDGPGRLPCPTKPDIDNVAKIVGDALQRAGVLRDDSCVWDVRAKKVYAAKTEGPRVEVILGVCDEEGGQ